MNEEYVLAAALSTVPRLGTRRLSAMLAVQSPSKAMEMLGRDAPGSQEIAVMKQKLEDGEMSVMVLTVLLYSLGNYYKTLVIYYKW